MISSEVQRTLVKSPPELWAEISDPESLARHLGEFGEIRITRVQPEQKVEWEADDASGTVVIKPSGWGTKVKLTVTQELAEPELDAEDDAEAETETEPEAAPDEPLELDAKPELAPLVEPEAGEDPEAEPEPAYDVEPGHEPQLAYEEPEPLAESEPEPRRGFFARLFRRRRARSAERTSEALAEPELRETGQSSEQPDMTEDDLGLETELATKHELTIEHIKARDERGSEHPEAEQALDGDSKPAAATDESVELIDVSAKTKLAEEIATEEVTVALTAVLDRLGAAHHRPFSRA
jgi:hypothetical protein